MSEALTKILSNEMVTKEEILQEVVFILRGENIPKEKLELATSYLDLHKIPVLLGKYDENNCTAFLNKEFLQKHNITLDELYQAAERNTKQEHHNTLRLVNEMMMVTNKISYLGAIMMTREDILDEYAREMEDDIWIIPSSIHEILLVPKRNSDYSDLVQYISEVNTTVVEPDEILSDTLYLYLKEEKRVVIAQG